MNRYENIPNYQNLSAMDCYKKIYTYNKNQGKNDIIKLMNSKVEEEKAYCDLVDDLPSPDKATKADMLFIFKETTRGLMEWTYIIKDFDPDGNPPPIYAKLGLFKLNGTDNIDEKVENELKKSNLYKKYNWETWMNNPKYK